MGATNWQIAVDQTYSRSPLPVAFIDPSGLVRYANRAIYPHLEIQTGNSIVSLQPKLWEAARSCHQDQNTLVFWHKASDAMISLSPVGIGNGEMGIFCSLKTDQEIKPIIYKVPEVKRLELVHNTIIDSISEGICITDSKGYLLRMNPVSAKLSDVRPEEVEGKHMADLEKEGLWSGGAALETLRHKKTETRIVPLLRRGISVLSTAKPVFDDDGELLMIVGTERNMLELEDMYHFLVEETAQKGSNWQQIKSLQSGQDISGGLIAKSRAMLEVLSHALKLAGVDSTLLLQGESGVGKGALANLIHRLSSRCGNPMVEINCAAIPETLLESELFGYRKGAFTGAGEKGKMGLIEIADGSTLFLDEVGDIPLYSQAKLLKFLETGEVLRLGDTQKHKVNVRIIAATNRNLEQMVTEGRFREDLYYRLAVIPLYIPPLRERKECVTALITHYIDHFARKLDVKKSITAKALETMSSYAFPGNIRELINICERLVVLSNRNKIVASDLPAELKPQVMPATPNLDDTQSLQQILDGVEREILIKTKEKHHSQIKMAQALGTTQSTVNRKLKKHGLT